MLQLKWSQPPNDYPTSDGKPMGENDVHRSQMAELIMTLEHYFKDAPDVYVTGNLLWFYQQGNKRRHYSPDVMVAFGVPKGPRQNYLQWQEKCVPQVVIELASTSTRREDLGRKFHFYEAEGVEEYYMFDAREDFVAPRFRANRLLNGKYIPVIGDVIPSPRLGLDLFVQGGKLRFREPHTGQVLLTPVERAERADAEAERANAEASRADAEAQRAYMEAKRADAEAARAAAAQERIAALERESAELRRRLAELEP